MNVNKIFIRIFFQHQKCFLHNWIILLIKAYLPHIYLVKTENMWVKLCMRRALLKWHSKPEFCVLLIMNWNYLILEMFSNNFIIFMEHNICSQQNFKKKKKKNSSIINICYACYICLLTEKKCYLKQTVNYGNHVTDWLLNLQRNLKYIL